MEEVFANGEVKAAALLRSPSKTNSRVLKGMISTVVAEEALEKLIECAEKKLKLDAASTPEIGLARLLDMSGFNDYYSRLIFKPRLTSYLTTRRSRM